MEPLHVTNGDCVTSTLDAAALTGTAISWGDVLHVGPLDAYPERSRRIRARFLADHGCGIASAIEAELEARDLLLARSVSEGRAIVLWFEHDLFDQLQLLQILSALDGAAGQVELVRTTTYLGSLSAAELEGLWPTRVEVTGETRRRAAAIWAAVCANELEAAAELAAGGLPHVRAAIRRLAEERGELSRTRRQLLGALAAGPRTAGSTYAASQAEEEAVFLGDAWAFGDVAALAAAGLVRTVDATPLPPAPPRGDVEAFADVFLELTPSGRAHV